MQADEEEEGEDPRWELIRKLVEYKKCKDAADKRQTIKKRDSDRELRQTMMRRR